jgi:hypothetical protein
MVRSAIGASFFNGGQEVSARPHNGYDAGTPTASAKFFPPMLKAFAKLLERLLVSRGLGCGITFILLPMHDDIVD